jgi:hypothetical protein
MNSDVARSGANPLLHFIRHGLEEGRAPNEAFAIAWDLLAVRNPVDPARAADVLDDAQHPADPLEQIIPGVTEPVALRQVDAIAAKLAPVRCHIDPELPRHLNVLLPHLHPSIIFGGYEAFFNYLIYLKSSGIRLRFLLVEPTNGVGIEPSMDLMRQQRPQIWDLVRDAPLSAIGNDRSIDVAVGRDDLCIAYSAWTMHLAADLAWRINRRHALFFIQEYEPVFHPNNSIRVLIESAYRHPHIAIFNSAALAKYFEENRLGIHDGRNDRIALERSGWFPHVLVPVIAPTEAELTGRGVRRLLFYARPEKHAERNLFEIGVFALREAIRKGAFEGQWEFVGLGSLRTSTEIDLGNGHRLALTPRIDGVSYASALKSFDVGGLHPSCETRN